MFTYIPWGFSPLICHKIPNLWITFFYPQVNSTREMTKVLALANPLCENVTFFVHFPTVDEVRQGT